MADRRSWRGSWIDRRFAIAASGSTPWREAVAGFTTFAAMMYIIAVNPAIMAVAGMDRGDVASATIIVSLLGGVIMGLSANLPLGLAPSMGSNAFFVFIMVGRLGLSWQEGLALILCSGIVILLLSLFRIRELLAQAVPEELKIGLQAAFGLFILIIALRQSNVTRVPIEIAPTLLVLGGFLLAIVLSLIHLPGALILSILVTTVAGTIITTLDGKAVTAVPAALLAWPHWPHETFLALDFGGLIGDPLKSLIAILFVTISECVGLLATTVTVMRTTGLDQPDGVVPGTTAAFASDATATIAGALLGTATVSPYVESVAGVQAGGRTGLTALVTAAGFGVALFFWPLLAVVPPQATAPALAVIGFSMIRSAVAGMDRHDVRSILPSLSMFVTTLITANLIDALAIGSLSYVIVRIGQDVTRRGTWMLCALFLTTWCATQLLG